jgi:hypothetical protein
MFTSLLLLLCAFLSALSSSLVTYNWRDLKADLSNIVKLRESNSPFLIRNFPVIEENKLYRSLQSIGSHFLADGKTSPSSHFTHHDYEKIWSYMYDMKATHGNKIFQNDEIIDMLNHLFLNDSPNYCYDTANRSYTYISQSVKDPINDKFLESLGSDMRTLLDTNIQEKFVPPGVMFWIANSPDVTVHSHYDMEDNFLIQLTGTKTITLSEPMLHPYYNIYPTYHPRSRQSQNIFLINLNNFVTSNITTNSTWEIILHEGDILYIPAFYFHSVHYSGSNSQMKMGVRIKPSSSVNLWFRSNAFDVIQQLINVDLPYTLKVNYIHSYDVKQSREIRFQNMLSYRLMSLARSIEGIVHQLYLDMNMFLMTFRSRHLTVVDHANDDDDFRILRDRKYLQTFHHALNNSESDHQKIFPDLEHQLERFRIPCIPSFKAISAMPLCSSRDRERMNEIDINATNNNITRGTSVIHSISSLT